MKKIIQDREYGCIKSLVFPGSFKKAELVLRALRERFSKKIILSEKLIASLRLSNSRRSVQLASFLNYILTSFTDKVFQIYVEKAASRKNLFFKGKFVNIKISRKFRFVVLV